MIKLKLRPPLTGILGVKEISVKLRQGTLRDILETAGGEHPRFKSAIHDADGGFSFDYKVVINRDAINLRDDLETVVSEDDEIIILMPIAGG